VTTQHIDDVVHAECEKLKVYPSPLNYFCFPKSVCTSVNEVICHGIPDTRPLVKGDIVNIDVTIYHRGFHADLNETFLVFDESVEEVDEDSRRLVKVTHDALMAAIRAAKPGMMFRQFGKIISQYVKKHSGNRYGVVRSYCGHGIGRLFHCAPNVPHYAKNKAVGVLKPGMCFTIEPMVNATKEWRDVTWTDNWTAVTVDGARSAQFEHTLLVTKTGVEILTARTEESVPFWWEQPQQAVEQDAVAN
ncbi:MAG: Methionine aminopeptidase 1, partial [Cercozoa sp. M6MM]